MLNNDGFIIQRFPGFCNENFLPELYKKTLPKKGIGAIIHKI